MKRETITYVPASQPGPHYLESGRRPAYSGYILPLVNVQLVSGVVCALSYVPTTDTFVQGHEQNFPFNVLCWWHLPAAVATTEREWFDEVGPSKGYVMDTQTKPGQYRFITNEIRPQFGSWCETLDDAVTDAYNHWVAAGRP